MKRIFLFAAFCFGYTAYAQETVKVESHVVKGNSAEMKKLMLSMSNITDKNYFDQQGNIVDSVTVASKLKTYDYTSGFGTPPGQTETKHMIFKIDPLRQKETDDRIKVIVRPPNPKLWEGETLDLKPFASHTDVSKLNGKTLVVIFWLNIPAYKYGEINDIIAKFKNNNKFEVLAVTRLNYTDANNHLKTNPILNAHFIVDAGDILDHYDLGNRAAIVLTDANHKITYSAIDFAAMTPRILYKQLSVL